MTTQTYPLNKINFLTVDTEETYNSNYSIIAYDNEGGVWEEKFASSPKEAEIKAKKMAERIIKEYK
jgi:hypothetical protein